VEKPDLDTKIPRAGSRSLAWSLEHKNETPSGRRVTGSGRKGNEAVARAA